MATKMEAIVLRTVDYGENNKILTLLTLQLGKIAALARGAKKPQSPLSAISQPFTYGSYIIQIGATQGMGTIYTADLLDSFRPIREDLYKTAYASYILELVDKFVEDREPSQGLYLLVLTTLQHLKEGKDPEIVARLVELNLLEVAGLRPELYQCAHCYRPLESSIRFSILHGGPLCGDCHAADERAVWMKPVTLRLLQTLQRLDIRRLGETRVGPDVKRQLNKILRLYVDEFSGVHVRSRNFLDQLHKYEFLADEPDTKPDP
ncbi:MAG TPA: DNA repair protein RecO [Bacilli bacterium]|nr:DNA repair protein RecO [Bacilli bacterium]